MNTFNDKFTRFGFNHQRTMKGSDNRSKLGDNVKLPSTISKEQE